MGTKTSTLPARWGDSSVVIYITTPSIVLLNYGIYWSYGDLSDGQTRVCEFMQRLIDVDRSFNTLGAVTGRVELESYCDFGKVVYSRLVSV